MLLNVVDHCLSLALAQTRRTAASRGALPKSRARGPLAAYPRLQAAMDKAEADGVLRRRHRV